jgi:hypothetical protein
MLRRTGLAAAGLVTTSEPTSDGEATMPCQYDTVPSLRRSALSAALAVCFGASVPLAADATNPADLAASRQNVGSITIGSAVQGAAGAAWRSQSVRRGSQPTTVHTVNTCADDDSPGSLRAIVESMNTASDDTIDLMHLPMGCSTITLDTTTHAPGHITIAQSYLHIRGPGSQLLTIEASGQSSIFRHAGYGTLDIDGVTIANGKYVSANQPFGGCIYSKGSVTLTHSRVESCVVNGTADVTAAAGGGIFAKHDVKLDRTSVMNNHANGVGTGSSAYGGGIYAIGAFDATYSTISDNAASADMDSSGGGVVARGDMISISSSTISSNRAEYTGGLYFTSSLGTAQITNSTISGNEGTHSSGGLFTNGVLKLSNSTVAFNRDQAATAGIGVAGPSVLIESSIIAGNGSASGPADLWGSAATTLQSASSNNLIVATTGISPPADTIDDCPRLDLLADNGQGMATHAL